MCEDKRSRGFGDSEEGVRFWADVGQGLSTQLRGALLEGVENCPHTSPFRAPRVVR